MDEVLINKCPYCLSDIPIGAKKCRFCGEWINIATVTNPIVVEHQQNTIEASSPPNPPETLGTTLNVTFKRQRVKGIPSYGRWRGSGSIAFSDKGLTISGKHIQSYGKRLSIALGITVVGMIFTAGAFAPGFLIIYPLLEFVFLDDETIDIPWNGLDSWAIQGNRMGISVRDLTYRNPIVFVPNDLQKAQKLFRQYSNNSRV